MRNLLGLFLILVVALTSCEGRTTTNQALSESIEEFKETNTIERITYTPESYTEVTTDTIFNSGFRIKIKFYSDMENQILKKVNQEDTIYKKYYREFYAQINISKNGNEIFNKTIDKNFILSNQNTNPETSYFKILSNVVINDEASNDGEKLNIEVWLNTIGTDIHDIYTMNFNEKGLSEIENNGEIEF